MLTLPLPERMSVLAVISVLSPRAWTRMLPEPLALTARPSWSPPSFRVMSPALLRKTMLPPEEVSKSYKVSVIVESAFLLSTRLTLTVTVATVMASLSSINIPPEPAAAVRVATVVSRGLFPAPIPLAAEMSNPAAFTSSPVLLSISTMEPWLETSATLPARRGEALVAST